MPKGKLIRVKPLVVVLNVHKVQKKQWAKWSPHAKMVFNATYGAMRQQGLFKHPKAPKLKAEHWKTTRWNAAWWAADEVDRAALRIAKEAEAKFLGLPKPRAA